MSYNQISLNCLFRLTCKLMFQETGPPEQGGRGPSAPPPKFPVDVPFFADEPFKCALFERTNQKCT